MSETKSYLPKELAIIRATKYCAYQERYQQQVRNKLYELSVHSNDVEDIITFLIEHNFLNESRYALSYARGKMRIKHWGVQKIKAQLKHFGITDYCIKQAIQALDLDEYEKILKIEIEKKLRKSKFNVKWMREKETKTYLIGKGFESQLIDEVLKAGF
jgi:regulatory protein